MNGISSKRIVTKGYGESKPVADNATEEGRRKNRRTEVRILED
jgi:outer membrane protein OmpA-like peptidoglycan-associated protein